MLLWGQTEENPSITPQFSFGYGVDRLLTSFTFKIKIRFFNQALHLGGHSNNPPQQQALNVVCYATITAIFLITMYNKFEVANHLRPDFKRSKFQSLNSWNLGWELLEPINIATDDEESELELSTCLSPGQKALYFIWYLDAQVTNGGFIQFYWNGYRKYLEPILEGLKLIGDTIMLDLVQKVDQEYLIHQNKFQEQQELDDLEPLYDQLPKFDEYDDVFYKHHDQTMALIEKYARTNTQEFVTLVD